MTFRFVATITVDSDDEIPRDFTGRVRLANAGVLESVSWLTRGELEDPGPRTPAYTRYRSSGGIKQIRHYRLGRLHDPTPGTPSVQGFFADGSRRYQEHYRYGRRHDYRDSPAIIKWRHDGTVRAQLHYYEGMRIEVVTPLLVG
jgi:hypothetical protein